MLTWWKPQRKRRHRTGERLFDVNHSPGTSQIMTLEIGARFCSSLGLRHEAKGITENLYTVTSRTRRRREHRSYTTRERSLDERSYQQRQLGDIPGDKSAFLDGVDDVQEVVVADRSMRHTGASSPRTNGTK